MRFDLLEKNPECDVFQEGDGKIFAVEHRLLIYDVDQNMRILMVPLRNTQIIDAQLGPLVLPVAVLDHFFER